MKIVYSGAQTVGAIQSSSLSSLGGYYSDSVVPNGMFDNVFDYVSRYAEKNLQDQYRCVFIINDSASSLQNVQLWVEDDSTSPNSKLLLAAVEAPMNGKVEILPSVFAKPYSVDDFYGSDENNKLLISNLLEPDAKIAIWIKREILETSGSVFDGTPSEVKAKIKALDDEKIEKKSLHISWD